mmetsp:Transcript_4797/g.5546  ORF Transcript_4797/g.5546 Transcript_4797/m.5546 type:complete len:352 (-) Transcript_4797:328-1383(-)|eukprot:CAMPEP_0204646206 /NCGR_PEP_ID=MMETSP0718-20130828/4198_1 /ASSEMBLY_ACC=CAM_ASM_000674 /TAXON_ID=230516 /ORGANISM="Chaetoceros curvisetus" /LENGTH=351 /DNA_ID=CAMNT_0051668387 /DNA_START=44 /DNA_END=1099 /DNA_ORIENTATION=+
MITEELSAPPSSGSKCVLFFWASWHEATAPGGSASKLYETLATITPDISFYRVEAEAQPDLSTKYNVTVVPSFVLIYTDGRVVQTIEGADDVARLTSAVSQLRNMGTTISVISSNDGNHDGNHDQSSSGEMTKEEKLNQRLERLIHKSQVMLFMKGSPHHPRCGFSRQAIELLTHAKISFCTFDILTDEDVRQGLKTYSDWPTYPQLYVDGELLGGLDIMNEMAEEGDLAEQMGVSKIQSSSSSSSDIQSKVESLDEKLTKLVKRSKVMLFMKGLPSQPRCGFSRKICEILQEQKIDFDAFDILGDEEVRQGLKAFSDWPTYPQLYVDGDLIGGLDIVMEMVEGDELKDLI